MENCERLKTSSKEEMTEMLGDLFCFCCGGDYEQGECDHCHIMTDIQNWLGKEAG